MFKRGRILLVSVLPLIIIFLVLIISETPQALSITDSEYVVLDAIFDAEVTSANPSTNFGDRPLLRVGFCCGEFPGESYVFIEFDLSPGGSPIPMGSTIQGATLALYLQSASGIPGGVDIALSEVSENWRETFPYPGITWNNKPGWTSQLSSTSVGTTEGWYEWSIPASVAHHWYTHPGVSYGIVLHWSGVSEQFSREFVSRHLSSVFIPHLRVEYTPPTTTTPEGWTPTTTTHTVPAVLTWPTPIDDDEPPEIEWITAPTEAYSDEEIEFIAHATDNNELALVQIWIDGVVVLSRPPSRLDPSASTFLVRDYLESGWHLYYALAYDTAGNGASTETKWIEVLCPHNNTVQIELQWAPENPTDCDTVKFSFTATAIHQDYLRDCHMSLVVNGQETWKYHSHISLYHMINFDYDVPLNTPLIYYRAEVVDQYSCLIVEEGHIILDPCPDIITTTTPAPGLLITITCLMTVTYFIIRLKRI